jgi:17beta-estradiol 17-dehydrogenase / very-long-chain 3-oxoacyl-CoA reductase
MTPTPKAYVKAALSHIGLPCGAIGHPYVSTPYWSHAIIQWLVDHVGTEWFWMWYTHSEYCQCRSKFGRKLNEVVS